MKSLLPCLSAILLAPHLWLRAETAGPTPPRRRGPPRAAPADPFRLKPLAGNVYALYGRGGNVGFFVGPDAVLVIDSQFKDLAPGIVDQIRKVSDRPIKFLLNTHHHGDHVGGNEVFKQFAMIIAHDNVRVAHAREPRRHPARLSGAARGGEEGGQRRHGQVFSDQIAWAKTVRVEDIPAPVMTFDSQLKIHMGDETIHVWHLPPAHTDGDSVVFVRKGEGPPHGRRLLQRRHPVHRRPERRLHPWLPRRDRQGDRQRLPPDATIIPGHGEVCDVAGLKEFRQYVVDLLDAARKARAAGRSKEDFLRDVDLPAVPVLERVQGSLQGQRRHRVGRIGEVTVTRGGRPRGGAMGTIGSGSGTGRGRVEVDR